jgi:hypothetical protein
MQGALRRQQEELQVRIEVACAVAKPAFMPEMCSWVQLVPEGKKITLCAPPKLLLKMRQLLLPRLYVLRKKDPPKWSEPGSLSGGTFKYTNKRTVSNKQTISGMV